MQVSERNYLSHTETNAPSSAAATGIRARWWTKVADESNQHETRIGLEGSNKHGGFINENGGSTNILVIYLEVSMGTLLDIIFDTWYMDMCSIRASTLWHMMAGVLEPGWWFQPAWKNSCSIRGYHSKFTLNPKFSWLNHTKVCLL